MANIHSLVNMGGADYQVVVHLAVPAGNNPAGTPWQTAVANMADGGTTVLKDGDGTGGTISAVEKAQIIAGTVVEVVTTLRLDTVALANVSAFLTAEFTRIQTQTLAELQVKLRFFGATR